MSHRYSIPVRAAAGIVGGVGAGVVMALVAMIHAGSVGLGFWLPMKLIAAIVWGVEALIGGAGVVTVGVFIHLAVAAGGGLVFGLVFGNRLPVVLALALGIIWGIVIWAINTWGILHWLNPVMFQRQMVAPRWWLGYHLIYGGMLMVVPPLTWAFGGSNRTGRW